MFTVFYHAHFREHCSLTRCITFFTIWTLTWLQFVVAQSQSPGQRTNHCAAVLGNSMVVVGGIPNSNSFFSSINLPISSQQSLQWRSLPVENALPVTEAACVVTLDGKLFVIGGTLPSNQLKSSATKAALQSFLQLYDPTTQKWTAQTVNPGGLNAFMYLRGHVAVSFNGPNRKGIFVFGGISELAPDDNPTYILEQSTDDNGNGWDVTQINRQSASPPGTLLDPGVSVLGSKVYIVGGISGTNGQASTSIYSFDTQSRKWALENTKHPLLLPCPGCTFVVGNYANRLYVISPSSKQGNNKTGNFAAPVQVLSFNPQNGGSITDVAQLNTTLSLKGGDDSIPTKGFSAVTFNQAVILYGGNLAGNSYSDQIYQFNMSSTTWSLPSDDQSNRNTTTSNSGNTPLYTEGTTSFSRVPIIFGSAIGCLGLIALVLLLILRVRANKSKKSKYIGSIKRSESGDTLTKGSRKEPSDSGDVLFISGLVRRLSLLTRNSVSNSDVNQEKLRTIKDASDRKHVTASWEDAGEFPNSNTTVVTLIPSEQRSSSQALEEDKT